MKRCFFFGLLFWLSLPTRGQDCPEFDFKAPLLQGPENTSIDWLPIRGNYWKGELTASDAFAPTRPFHCFSDSLSFYFLNAEHRTDSLILSPHQSGFYTFTVHAEFDPVALLLKGSPPFFIHQYPCENIIAGTTEPLQDSSFTLGVNLISWSQYDRAGLPTKELPQLRFGAYLERDQTYTLLITSRVATQRGHYLFHFFTPEQTAFEDTLFTIAETGFMEAKRGWLPHTLERFDLPELLLPQRISYQTDSIGRLLSITTQDSSTLSRTGFPHSRGDSLQIPDSVLNGVNYYGQLRDTCHNISVYVADLLTVAGDCSTPQVERTFLAVDAAGNTSSRRSQILTFALPKKENIQQPPLAVTVSCGSSTDPMDLGGPAYWHPNGWIAASAIAPLAITHEDGAQVHSCAGSYSFARKWSIYDWCRPSNSHTFTQIIQVIDTVAPAFTLPDTLVVNTHPATCQANVTLPLPTTWSDSCSTPSLLHISGMEGIYQDGSEYKIDDLDTGSYSFLYTVTDECGNLSQQSLMVQVVDSIGPSIDCDDEIQISLGDTLAIIEASRFAEGLYENCGLVHLSISHLSSDWLSQVSVGCADQGTYLSIRATEIGTQLSTYCRTKISIADQQPVTCMPPDSVVLFCDEWIYDSTEMDVKQFDLLFGAPSGKGNCSWQVEELAPNYQLDLCGIGQITRTFSVTNGIGKLPDTCHQVIQLLPHHQYEIKFPEDFTISNCNGFLGDTPEWSTKGCDLLTISSDTTLYVADSEECYQFFVTYRLINWCEYREGDPVVIVPKIEDTLSHLVVDHNQTFLNGQPFAASTGFWEYEQRIEVRDTVPPAITFPNLSPICAYGSCLARVEFPFNILDNCSTQDLKFKFFYDAFRNGTYDDPITFFAEDPIQDSLFGVYGRAPKLRMIGYYPVGEHYLVIEAEDGCGNKSRSLLPFEVIDCKGPAPLCIDGLAIELMPGETGPVEGMAEVKATDFLVAIPNDCTDPVSFSIHFLEDSIAKEDTLLALNCGDIGTRAVKIVGWDGAGNTDYCITTLQVQDNLFPICTDATDMLTGHLMTPNGHPLTAVSVRYLDQTVQTNEEGQFLYPEHALETVQPMLEENPLLGISTYDLILISAHILGTQPLEDHLGLMAADVNQSGTISTLDVIELRKLLLRVIPHLDKTPVWHYPIQTDQVAGDRHWMAIKTGDVNHSYSAQLSPRSQMVIPLSNSFVEAGSEIAFILPKAFFADYTGGQMSISYRSEILELLHADVHSETQNTSQTGQIHLSWMASEWEEDWTFVFRAAESGYISDWIGLNREGINPEVYDQNGAAISINWQWESLESPIQFGPNPFSEGTHLMVWSDEVAEATIWIHNESGQNIWKGKESLQIGTNALYISSSILGQPGIYMVQVDLGNTQWTKKMVFVK